MAGSCASPNSDEISPTDCLAVGTCASPSAAGSENECGTCSDVSAVKKDACASVNGVWTAGQWTKTGVWETPEGGYTGDFYHTDHIHSIAANANYVYDGKTRCNEALTCDPSAQTGALLTSQVNITEHEQNDRGREAKCSAVPELDNARTRHTSAAAAQ